MEKSMGVLDALAARYGVFVSDLRINPQLRQMALLELQAAKDYLEGEDGNK